MQDFKKKRPFKFIVIEGMDNSGKSSIAKALADRLTQDGHCVKVYGNPGGDDVGMQMRKIIKDNPHLPKDVQFMQLATNRLHLSHLIKKDIEDGCIVICDRWDLSAHAYQAYTVATNLKDRIYYGAFPLHQKMFNLPNPDLLIYCDATLDVIRQRTVFNQEDAYEAKDDTELEAWYDKMRKMYLPLFTYVIAGPLWANRITRYEDIEKQEIELFKGMYNDHCGYIPYDKALLLPITDASLSAEENVNRFYQVMMGPYRELVPEKVEKELYQKHMKQQAKVLAESEQATEEMVNYFKELGLLAKDYKYEKKVDHREGTTES